jgi:hypothetical protein
MLVKQRTLPAWVRRGLVTVAVWLTLAGAGAGVVLSTLWGLQLLVAPQPVAWLERWVPRGDQDWSRQITSLEEIEAEAESAGLWVGDPVTVTAEGQTHWLLPLWQTRPNCSRDCDTIVEVRALVVLVPDGSRLQLQDQVAISGPEEAFVVAPLQGTSAQSIGSSRVLPLTQIRPLPEMGSGHWYTLWHQWQRGSSRVDYGQVIHYSASQGRLRRLVRWTSPARALPAWMPLEPGEPAVLVIDQTVGLEPQFQGFQLTGGGMQMRPISLSELALVEADPRYEQVMVLARAGLWSDALARLEQLKADQADRWTLMATAQHRLIERHAQVTRRQAEQSWASPNQKMLALLIDGQWQAALTLLTEAANYNATAVTQESGRLWQRVVTSLQVNPTPAAQVWGALLLMAQQDQATAQGWLARQTNPGSAQRQFQQILLAQRPPEPSGTPAELATESAEADAPPAASGAESIQGIVGTVSPLSQVNGADWRSVSDTRDASPGSFEPGTLGPNQQWLVVQVQAIQQGGRWQLSPAADRLTALGTGSGGAAIASLQLLLPGNSGPQGATVQTMAVRQQGSRLDLLVAAPTGASTAAIAITQGLAQGLSPNVGSALRQWRQQQPAWAEQIVAQLSQQLDADLIDSESLLQAAMVQSLDVTADGNAEAVVALNLDVLGETPAQAQLAALPQHWIITPDGTVLYQSANQPLQGWLPGGLLIRDGDRYQVWLWNQGRFRALD